VRMKKIFIAATRQNEGKTTVCLGLMLVLPRFVKNLGFIKPVGQRYVLTNDGHRVDEDAILIHEVCQIYWHPKDMSPVAIEKGFTRQQILVPDIEGLKKQILDSYRSIAEGKDFVLIEGTGHAGVGSVFAMNNANVAHLLDAKVIIVTTGGIGRPIDEIMLNKCLFENNGVEVIGAILNKAIPEKMDSAKKYVSMYLERAGIKLLGTIPYNPLLSGPTMRQIREETGADVVHGEEFLDNAVRHVVLGAMMPHDALKYIKDEFLFIVPGTREDNILAALSTTLLGKQSGKRVSGIVLTGEEYPHKNILEILRNTNIPVLQIKQDSYTVASRIHDLTVKIRPADREKIELVRNLVNEYVDVEEILKLAD